MTPSLPGAHPDAVTLAEYIDRRLAEADRGAVAEHLIGCVSCRSNVADVSRVTGAEALRRRALAGATMVMGAAAVLLFVVVPRDATVPPFEPVERFGGAGAIPAILVWSPDARSTAAFAWSPIAPGAQYRLSLTDAAGDEVWTVSTPDTTATRPASVVLARGADYFWVVDALLPDGGTATSGIRQLPRGP